MIKTAVAILNWNGLDFLKKFLPSVVKYSNQPDVNIFVIDNASSDKSIEFLKQNYPQIKLVILDKNYGYAGGYNKGLKQIKAKYYVLLNSDIEVTENWINPIINLMENNKKILACQPKILSYNNKEYFEYAGASGGYIDKYGYPFCRGRIFDTIEKDNHQYDDIKQVFWATGACLFIDAEKYFKLGGLDNDFFAHMEEIDLCWRINNAGYKIFVNPQSVVYHVGGGTLQKTNPKKTYLNFRNNLYLLYKNLPDNKLFNICFVRKILDAVAAIKFLFSFKFKDALAVFKAHINFYKTKKYFKNKRKLNKEITVINNHKTILQKNIIWQYYIKGKKKFNNYTDYL